MSIRNLVTICTVAVLASGMAVALTPTTNGKPSQAEVAKRIACILDAASRRSECLELLSWPRRAAIAPNAAGTLLGNSSMLALAPAMTIGHNCD